MSEAAVQEPQVATSGNEALLQRADLLYCLAQAFLPPPSHWTVCDWAQPLVDDLTEMAPGLPGLDLEDVKAALAAECARWAAQARAGGGDTWLVEYSRLFLVPPVPVTLNAGVYLEGALGGSSTQMMLACYEMAGVKPDERFHDLPDHVAMQLEFLARLYERAARGDADAQAMAEEFAAEFVHAWGGALQQACRKAAASFPAAAVFVALARLVRQTLGDPGLV
ncbi:MAG: molecular chaperone TorD family protein [Hydrogenophaga sp.]|uniref:TorD/DmsD family molecular chaperone n=1 Tax=Hydrogenophaga sp. TaxID=1904254 RepID=UPI002717746F|nr:molecular chaperone TorD family protein [Hydrogenophaga sp.]MDO9568257.1 molecular chaperone TorD family protein [Hydrogenophaga sp.]MDP2095529.1 molecular chaperone TorD family protein [Hydrogenophaga sp.]